MYFNGKLLFRCFQQTEEIIIILFIVKYPHPHIAAIDDMVDTANRLASCYSWHSVSFFSKNLTVIDLKSSLSPFFAFFIKYYLTFLMIDI